VDRRREIQPFDKLRTGGQQADGNWQRGYCGFRILKGIEKRASFEPFDPFDKLPGTVPGTGRSGRAWRKDR